MVTKQLHVKLEDFNVKWVDFDVRWGLAFTIHILGLIRPKWKL